jgi:alcohol dehydrogenase YqhD (iron-dependent ADH family)
MPTTLKDYGISQKASEKIIERFRKNDWKMGEHEDIDYKALRKILRLCR